MVCQQGLHDGSQDRNAAADTGFKQEVDTVFLRQSTELGTVNRHHLLVGCDCALSGTDGLFYKSIGRFHTAHDLCNDADFDLEGHVTKKFARSVGRAEEAAVINGDGVDAPEGFIKKATLGHSTSEITYDDVIRLFFSLDKEYRRNAVWLMNDKTALKLRTLKDASGNYLWNHTDNTIMGKPVHISNYMPDAVAGDNPIAFGDFSYLWVIDRIPFAMRRLNERYAVEQRVAFIGYEYLDAKLIRPDAVHVMQISQ